MKRSSVAHLNCSIAQALEIVGEWWTPLVLRNIMMGQRRFEQIQADLGIARNILSDRLSTLVDAGVLTRERYHDAPVRYEYRLTEMGSDLFGSLMALMAWGDRWLSPDGPPMEVLHKDCGEVTRPVVSCEHCHGELDRRNVRMRPGAGWGPPTGVTLPASV